MNQGKKLNMCGILFTYDKFAVYILTLKTHQQIAVGIAILLGSKAYNWAETGRLAVRRHTVFLTMCSLAN